MDEEHYERERKQKDTCGLKKTQKPQTMNNKIQQNTQQQKTCLFSMEE